MRARGWAAVLLAVGACGGGGARVAVPLPGTASIVDDSLSIGPLMSTLRIHAGGGEETRFSRAAP